MTPTPMPAPTTQPHPRRPTGPFLTDEIVDRSYGIIPLRLVTSTHPSDSASAPTPTTPSASTTQVLLIHQKTRRNARFWALPKGHAEACDGSVVESAVRELREETGLVVREEDLLRIPSRDGDGEGEVWSVTEKYWQAELRGWKEVRFFAAVVGRTHEVVVQDKEIAGAEWCSWERALELASFEETRETLGACLGILGGV